jgi:hypothetical protein
MTLGSNPMQSMCILLLFASPSSCTYVSGGLSICDFCEKIKQQFFGRGAGDSVFDVIYATPLNFQTNNLISFVHMEFLSVTIILYHKAQYTFVKI